MVKTNFPAKKAVAQIVQEYRQLAGSPERPATLRAFAAALSAPLASIGRAVSYQSIKNWCDRRYLPDPFVMLQLSHIARHDWRGDFAEDILAAVHPHTYPPATEIGRRAIRDNQQDLQLGRRLSSRQPSGAR